MTFTKVSTGYQVRLFPGENAHEAFIKFAKKEGIKGVAIAGLGAVKDVELGYLHLDEKKFHFTMHEGMYELVGLNGNISMIDGEPSVHLHGLFSDNDHLVIGGHVKSMIVAVAIEAHVITHGVEFIKEMDEFSGLKMLKLSETL